MTVTGNDYIKGIREDVDKINKVQPFQNKEKQINDLLQKYLESYERDYIQKYSELQINVFDSRLGELSYVLALLAMAISVLIWKSVYYTQFIEHNKEIIFIFFIFNIIIVFLILWLAYIPIKKRPLKDIIMAIVEDELLRKIQVNGFHSKNKNMKETQTQKNTYYECNELEDLVNKAIKEGKPDIDFTTMKTEECKYIQKFAEARFSWFGVNLNAIIFFAAIGASLSIGHNIGDYRYLIGIIIIVSIIRWPYKWKQKYDVCEKIILNAERKLLQMEIESKKSHSDICYPPSNYRLALESEENRSIE